MPEDFPVAATQTGLSKEQKIGVILLSLFAFLAVGLGFLQIRNTFYGPLALNNKVVSAAVKEELNGIDALRLRDTDRDELNDFDELYVYGTSPYLYDTFSYGMSDKEVVGKGLALCPKGQDCSNPIASGGAEVTAAGSSTVPVAALNPGPPPPDLLKSLSDPSQIRQLLISSGTDPKLLEKISDKELMDIMQQVLSSTSTIQSLQSINALVPTR